MTEMVFVGNRFVQQYGG